jgi:hypothetical protein
VATPDFMSVTRHKCALRRHGQQRTGRWSSITTTRPLGLREEGCAGLQLSQMARTGSANREIDDGIATFTQQLLKDSQHPMPRQVNSLLETTYACSGDGGLAVFWVSDP